MRAVGEWSTEEPRTSGTVPEFALIYPLEEVWHKPDSTMKNMLLFFDGVAIVEELGVTDRFSKAYPETFSPLMETGLLRNLEPSSWITPELAERVLGSVRSLLDNGHFHTLNRGGHCRVSGSQMGFGLSDDLAYEMVGRLTSEGLIGSGTADAGFNVARSVSYVLRTLLAQALRGEAHRFGITLAPATCDVHSGRALAGFLDLSDLPSSGSVVCSDMMAVGLDLDGIPLDEVLDYRRENRDLYVTYARSVRRAVREVASVPRGLRAEVLRDRSEILQDSASQVRHAAAQAWNRPLTLALSGVGALWSAAAGDPTGAMLGFGAAAAGMAGASAPSPDVFSYLFATPRRWVA